MSAMASSSPSPHVLWALSSMEMGGTEIFSLEIIPRLMRQARVTVLLTERKGELYDKLRATGVEIVEERLGGKFHRKRIGRARQLICDLAPDIVHTHSLSTHYLIRIASILARTPVILPHLHGMLDNRFKDTLKQRERRLLPCTDRMLFVSRAVLDSFRDVVLNGSPDFGRFEDKLEVVHDGVDIAAFNQPRKAEGEELRREYGIPEGAPVIGNVGRFDPIKNIELLIDVVRVLKQRYPAIRCLLVGDGRSEYRSHLEQRCKSRGVADNVVFAGYRMNTAAHFGLFDVSLLTSRSEGLPRSVVESMAAGTPVVATALPGLDEVIENGVSGYLVPGREAGGIAERVVQLLEDRALRDRLASGARARAKHYDLDRYTDRLMGLYRSALETRSPRVRRSRRLFRIRYAALKRI